MRLVVAFHNFTNAPKKTGFVVPASLNATQHPRILPFNDHPPCFPTTSLLMGGDQQTNSDTEIGTSKSAVKLKKLSIGIVS